jgi:DNA/RNA endonuclease G (NUC1)
LGGSWILFLLVRRSLAATRDAPSSPFYLHPRRAGPISDHLRRLAYTTAYDRRLRIPAWTAEHLTKENLKGSGTRSESVFKEDQDVPERFRAHLLDYFKSGYGAFASF